MHTRSLTRAAIAVSAGAVLAGCGLVPVVPEPTVTTLPPRPAATIPPAPSPSWTPPAREYTKRELRYFEKVAFGSEFGDPDTRIRKWDGDVRIAVHGKPTARDLETLDAVLADLNRLIDTIELSVVPADGNVDLHFAPESKFSSLLESYTPVNQGYFTFWWDETGCTYSSTVLISTTNVTQKERSHLLREELTQMLGLANDTYDYDDSLFYQGWTSTQKFAAIDEALVEMLYRPDITCGMTADQARAVLVGD